MRKLMLIMAFFVGLAFARVDDYIAEVEVIKGVLNESIELYKKGDAAAAKKRSEDAYFQHFENIEGQVGRNLGRKAIKMERKFNKLRRMYKDGADIRHAQALIDGLVFDLDEVAPIIQNGFRLVAEKSESNMTAAEEEAASVAAEKARADAAAALFAAFDDEDEAAEDAKFVAANSGAGAGANSNLAGAGADNGAANSADNGANSNLAGAASAGANAANSATSGAGAAANSAANSAGGQSADDAQFIAQLEAASAIHPKLQTLADNIGFKFSQAASEFRANNTDEAKRLLNSALFDDYRNTKAEVVVKGISGALDSKIQRGIRAVITKINEDGTTERDIRYALEEVEDVVYDAFLQIPQEQIAKIIVENFDESTVGARDYGAVADDIKIALTNLLEDYDGFNAASIDALQNIYLDIFEASGMESRVGAVDSAVKLKIEALFSQGVALIKASAPKDELAKCFDELNEMIASMVDKIQESTPLSLFIWALGIILREGMEALIIVVAIVAYLIQSGNAKQLKIAYSALLAGVILSFVTAFAVSWIFKQNAGQSRELIEGVCMLIAVALLFYVGFWLLSNALNKKWADFIKGQVVESINAGSARTLWWTVFLAVYREGAETVLFYQALLIDAVTSTDYSAVFAGLGVGSAIIIVLYFLLKAGAIRIPVKQFFYVTSYIIFYMVFVFTGKGVAELIEGKFVTPTLIPFKFESITWLGLHPYYESLVPQLLVLAVLVAGIVITHKKSSSNKGASNV